MIFFITSTGLFLLTLIIGTFHALSRNSFILIWLGIELNILSIVPIITSYQKWREPQAAFIYLYAQATGSLLFLRSVIIEETQRNPSLWIAPPLIIIIALLIKAGAAPYHFWVPLVIQQTNWISCIIIATWQKLIPLFILSKIIFFSSIYNSPLITLIALFGAIIGRLGGLNQTQLRPLMAFSSIQHIGWILIASLFRFSLRILYLFLYVFSTFILFLKFFTYIIYTPTQTTSSLNLNQTEITIIKITLISITGLPPLIIFYPKIVTLIFIVINFLWFPAIVIILCNTVRLAYYLRIFLTINTPFKGRSLLILKSPSLIFPYSFILSISLILAPTLFFIIYALTFLNKP